MKRLGGLLLLLLTGCADTLLGISPLEEGADRLTYPFGLAAVEGPTPAQDTLLVVSTNLDQRFNAGLLAAFDFEALAAQVEAATCEAPIVRSRIEGLRGALRVPSGSGRLVPFRDGARLRLALPTRFGQSLSLFDLDPGGRLPTPGTPPEPGDLVSCRAQGASTETALDCAASHRIGLDDDDPFDVAPVYDEAGELELLAVTHLGGNGGPISVVGADRIRARLDPQEATDPEAAAGRPIVANVSGLTGSFAATGLGPGQLLVTTNGDPTVRPLRIARLESSTLLGLRRSSFADVGQPLGQEGRDPSVVIPSAFADLEPETSGERVRGLATRADRPELAWVALRIIDDQGAQTENSVIATVDLTESPFRVLSVFEVGEQIGRPVFDPVSGLLYVPDERRGLFVLDVSGVAPLLVAQVDGRAQVAIGGGFTRGFRLLSSPTEVAFDPRPRQGRRLLYASNFLNSTLGVIDVTEPSRPCVVARLGEPLDPGNESRELLFGVEP
ncbi:MAG: hypothetical protein AAGD10_08005 [Myxococcota bacterium]